MPPKDRLRLLSRDRVSVVTPLLELKAVWGVRYLGRCPRKRFLASGEARRRIWWDRLHRQLQVGKERDRLYVVQVWGNRQM